MEIDGHGWIAALDTLEGAYSQNTMLAYRSDYGAFAAWCSTQNIDPYPTTPPILLAYLEQLPSQLKPTTVRRRVIAIGRLHTLGGLSDPANDIRIAIALRKRNRQHGSYPDQAYGLTRDRLQSLLDVCDQRLRGLRDRAMLLIGFETLCRREELVRIRAEDIGVNLRNLPTVAIHDTKNGPFIRQRRATLSRVAELSLNNWLDASGMASGPIFRPVYQNTVVNRQLGGFMLARVLKELARRANWPEEIVAQVSGHSLRVGAAQQLALNGYDTAQIMQVGGWKSITALSRYIEGAAVNLWEDED